MNVAIIPARGGSRRIPRKNIRPFHGKPIIAYSIEAALASGLFDGGVWVSTEDAEIAGVALNYGAGVIQRPPELAEVGAPDCGTQEVTRHAIEVLSEKRPIDIACCIYAAAPLISAGDLRYSFEVFFPSTYRYVYVNGWYYWGNAKDFGERPELEQSLELDRLIAERWIDIDTEEDWGRAEQMYVASNVARSATEGAASLIRKYGGRDG